ncbi:MAG: hypothetical protein Hals2KO_10880 [Halioglobus sp.]
MDFHAGQEALQPLIGGWIGQLINAGLHLASGVKFELPHRDGNGYGSHITDEYARQR